MTYSPWDSSNTKTRPDRSDVIRWASETASAFKTTAEAEFNKAFPGYEFKHRYLDFDVLREALYDAAEDVVRRSEEE